MKKRRTIGVVLVAAAVLIVGSRSALGRLVDSRPPPVPVATPGAAGSATPGLNPIEIAAMRARAYASGPIVIQRRLGEQGGYSANIVAFKSDGLTEYGYWAQPDGRAPAGGWPVIILVHGYINPSTYNTLANAYSTWIAAWARAGFVVVQPDLRGNGSSQGGAVSGHWSPDYTYDIMNLIATLKADKTVNREHIGLVGHSMGGHVALNVAVISRDIAATMLVNGVVGSMNDLLYNWPNSPAPYDQPAAEVQGELTALEQTYGTPKTDPGFWNAASAINFVSNVSAPLQIDADSGDATVPYKFSKELDAAMQTAHKSVSMYTYSGNDHQLDSPTDQRLFLARSTAFWQQTLK